MTKSHSSSSFPHASNRVRHSCACVCDSVEEVQVMEVRPREEPGLGDERSETWVGCVLKGIQRTVGASDSSLQKTTQMAGWSGYLFGACSLAALGAPDWAGWRCHWRLQRRCGLVSVQAKRILGGGIARCSHCYQIGGGGREQDGGGTSLLLHNAS